MITVLCELKDGIGWVTLNRSERGNSYDHDQARAIAKTLNDLATRPLKAIVLRGDGKHFCTGADLSWMGNAIHLTPEENLNDMSAIRDMYQTILNLNVPLVIVAKGKIRGGGVGLVACAEYAFCLENADFALTEKKLGLVPGIITPFVVSKIGEKSFAEISETGKEFTSREAKVLGLVQKIVPSEPGETEIGKVIDNLNGAGFHARMQKLRSLIQKENQLDHYWKESAKMRHSPEFREFLRSKKI